MNTINYRIKSMQVVNSSIDPDQYIEEGKLQIHNSLSFTMAVNECLLLCRHSLSLKKNDNVFAKITLETIFSITPDSVEGMKVNDKLEIPRGFLVQCGSISYGTLRGVVLKCANDVGLDNVIIPPVFINTIIRDSMIIDLKESK